MVDINKISPFYPADPALTMVTQSFGVNAAAYAQYGIPGHNGIDIGSYGGANVNIYAAESGVVITAKSDNTGYGNYIVIDHGGYKTLYAHLSSFKVKVNDLVSTGDVIGEMGTTGNSTGVHLHFELIVPGQGLPGYKDRLNPAMFFGAIQGDVPAEPVVELEVGKSAMLAGNYDYVNIRAQPSIKSADIGDLPPGVKLPVLEIDGKWAMLGVWVHTDYLCKTD